MTGYFVKLTPKAEVDFDEIVAGIIDHAPRTVSQWYSRFRRAVDESHGCLNATHLPVKRDDWVKTYTK